MSEQVSGDYERGLFGKVTLSKEEIFRASDFGVLNFRVSSKEPPWNRYLQENLMVRSLVQAALGNEDLLSRFLPVKDEIKFRRQDLPA